MTAYLEEFGSDPSWNNEGGTYTHDATNGELAIGSRTGGNVYSWRSDDAPGGMEHECQGTFITFTSNAAGYQGPVGVRMTSGAVNGYDLEFEPGAGTGGTLYLVRTVAGAQTTIQTWSIDIDTSTFWTVRLAAEGGNGANVSLSIWYTDHGASKPSLQDWIGSDGSPNQTYTDTAANRLDDSSANLYCGTEGYSESNYDIRLDYHRLRLVSDRGAGAPTPKNRTLRGPFHGPFAGPF